MFFNCILAECKGTKFFCGLQVFDCKKTLILTEGVWEVYGRCMGGVWEVLEQHLPCLKPCVHRCSSHLMGGVASFLPNVSLFAQMTILSRPNHIVISAKLLFYLSQITYSLQSNAIVVWPRTNPSIGPINPNNRSERFHQSVRAISMIAPSNRSPNPAFSLL